MSQAYVVGRAAAALAGIDRLTAEIESLIARPSVVAIERRIDLIEEARRANRAARGYSNSWRSRALELVESGASVTEAEAVAHRELSGRLLMGSDMEATDAFYAARRDASEIALSQDPDLAVMLEQVWNVSWCKNTCDTCSGLDGMTLPFGEAFPQGEPPLHPRCGCEIDIRPTRM